MHFCKCYTFERVFSVYNVIFEYTSKSLILNVFSGLLERVQFGGSKNSTTTYWINTNKFDLKLQIYYNVYEIINLNLLGALHRSCYIKVSVANAIQVK